MRILVVDDDRATLEFTEQALDEVGYTVTTLSSPEGVAMAIAKDNPDLVLLDVTMPGLSGVDVMRFLKASRETKDIPIVLYSVLPQKELEELAERVGAFGWIPKTENAETLRDCIYRLRMRLGK